ncbi:hypothetical protein [Hyphomicrobium sp.]|uniref:hypothetical protein n=1 Tax=Hyphomicrobium sp. TaxID=82 RepID=UPI002E30EDF1|nr:hypothetical protein [Hyphomicrobium sp.]HEX2842131.1 hypothetical protein [Hyphomicrobium sp.]
MVSINKQWWEHLAPKRMHARRREVELFLAQWCRSDYGTHWLSSASKPHGVIRAKPGQILPVVRFIALADRPVFIVPQEKVLVGHRTVNDKTDFASGQALEGGELVFTPTISLDLVEDEAMLAAARRGDSSPRVEGVRKPALVFSAPASLLIAPSTWPKRAYVLYQHIFGSGGSYPDDGYFYVGVTTRSWQQRWNEHRRSMESGSPLLFHKRLREELDAGRVSYIHHKVMGITDDLEALYGAEERLVEGHWHDERRLNMIPGGKSALRYMREHGMLPDRVVPSPDERDRLVTEWLHAHPRKGLPAPWVAEKWKDNAWAVAQICGRDGRLSVEQVLAIRELSATHSVETIALRIGASNTEQVQRVLDGKTYTRVT